MVELKGKRLSKKKLKQNPVSVDHRMCGRKGLDVCFLGSDVCVTCDGAGK